MLRVIAAVGIVLAAAAILTPPPAAQETRDPVENFMQVSPTLYRGGQPDAAGFAALREMGVRTVINLRTEDDERRTVEGLGMTYVHVPVRMRPFGATDPNLHAAVTRFFAAIDDPASGTVFVHCRRGADRTGAFVALYRVVRQGWTTDRAYQEARSRGLRWWHLHVRDWLEQAAKQAAHG